MPAITRVDVIATGPPMPDVQFTDALPAVYTTVTYAVVTDDTGVVGLGAVESDTFGGFDLAPLEALRPLMPAVIGRNPLEPSVIAELASQRVSTASRKVPCAALEIACWDLTARHAGLPLHQLLGGARDEVPAYASLPFERDPETLLDLAGQVSAAGYRAAKVHVSGDPAADVASVTLVRAAFPALDLIVDAESVYDREGATSVGRALDDLRIAWFEAPLSDRDLDGCRALTQSLSTPIVPAGGLIDDPSELANALSTNPWSSIRTQTMEGGIDHVRAFAALGRAHGLDLELCSYGTTVTQAIDLHVILGLGVGTYYEQPFPIEPWEFGTTTPIVVEDGLVRAPAGPGLAMELDMSSIDQATLARFTVKG